MRGVLISGSSSAALFLLLALGAACSDAGAGDYVPTGPTEPTISADPRIAFWAGFRTGPALIDVHLDGRRVGTIDVHWAREEPEDCDDVNEEDPPTTHLDPLVLQRPPGTYAYRGRGYHNFPGDRGAVEWSGTVTLERGVSCTTFEFDCGSDRDCYQ